MNAGFGDIVLAAGGTYSSKPRPVLVFQNATHPTGDSIVVIPFTTETNPAMFYRVPVPATTANGLDRDCWLEVDKVSAIRVSWIGPAVGRLEPQLVAQAIAFAHQLMSPLTAS